MSELRADENKDFKRLLLSQANILVVRTHTYNLSPLIMLKWNCVLLSLDDNAVKC